MIILKNTVSIKTTPTKAFQWFEHLDENYLAWHPAHVSCRYLKGKGLKEGSVLYAEEYIHGTLHKLKLHLTKVVRDREFQYRVAQVFMVGFNSYLPTKVWTLKQKFVWAGMFPCWACL